MLFIVKFSGILPLVNSSLSFLWDESQAEGLILGTGGTWP